MNAKTRTTGKRLTDRQKKFCEIWAKNPTIEGGIDAYLKVYSSGNSYESARRQVQRFKHNRCVMEYMDELMSIDEGVLTKAEHMTVLKMIRDKALADGDYAAAYSCERSRGEVAGLYTGRKAPDAKVNLTPKGCLADGQH